MTKNALSNDLVGRNIRILRIYRGYSQEELADRCSISRATMSKLENGMIKEISFQQISILADALNVKESSIMSLNPLYHIDAPNAFDPEDLSKESICRLIRGLSPLMESEESDFPLLKYFINILRSTS